MSVQEALKSRFPQAAERASLDHPAVGVPAAELVAVLAWLRAEQGFDALADLTAVDWAEGVSPRFTVVYHLYSTARHDYIRVAADCPNDAAPEAPSVSALWAGANWHEREVFDMFGIRFSGHPDLRRILMWDGYPHHPLRKEFPLAGIEAELSDPEIAAETQVKVKPAPMAGGPFVAVEGGINLSETEPTAKDESWAEKNEKPVAADPEAPASVQVAFGDSAARAAAAEPDADRMSLSMGPSHPSTHGVLRVQMELDGEVVIKADPVVGYLHRGDEKIAENMTYNQFVPYTDRLDYLAPLANNMAYAIAVEKLAKLEVPPRCQAIRVVTAEMARISSHLMGLGAFGIDVGAWTVFLYTFTEREKLYKLFEELTGARFTTSYTRIGGVSRDVPPGWLERVDLFCKEFLPSLEETMALLTRNKIFMDRTVGIGVISKEDALAYGLTGPNLRGSGVALDLRKDRPYSGYEQYDFDVPVGTQGDCYDRYLVRGEEMRQSVRIIQQAIAKFPGGPWHAVDAPRIFLPPKEKILTSMEELIQNFMLVTEGPQMPAGEVYFEAENPKGVLGFYIVSKGGGVPWRLKIRSPSFCNLSILPKTCVGAMVADIVSILGSFDFVMGECDR